MDVLYGFANYRLAMLREGAPQTTVGLNVFLVLKNED